VAGARSVSIKVIKHKLELDLPVGSWAGQWYNAEKGKYNCISLPVKLVDAAGSLVIGRQVPLTARLLYESGTAVPDQANVLKVHDSSSAGISRDTGKGELKVRLEQVSGYHSTNVRYLYARTILFIFFVATSVFDQTPVPFLLLPLIYSRSNAALR